MSQNRTQYPEFKIVMVGDHCVGKTSISSRFIDNTYTKETDPTSLFSASKRLIKIENREIQGILWDTSGHQKMSDTIKLCYKGALGIVVVYDITQESSYNKIELLLKSFNEYVDIQDVPVIILGNMLDRMSEKQVGFARVMEQYKVKRGFECFEVSAKTGEGVEEAMMYLIKEIYKKNIDNLQSLKEKSSIKLSLDDPPIKKNKKSCA